TSSHFSHPATIAASPATEETALLWAEPQTKGGQ
ncbi:lytic transglycosylase domain-containing protein, partial [Salmonella enterica subsp. diarizonae]|nr:lytic transglycosylase domain-containing protein [Salmonella enterica subsp. diarizonae]